MCVRCQRTDGVNPRFRVNPQGLLIRNNINVDAHNFPDCSYLQTEDARGNPDVEVMLALDALPGASV